MGHQHIFSIIFISGVFLGLLHCYPLLGEDSLPSSDHPDGDDTERIHRNVLPSTRLQRLVQTFVHLVQLDKQGADDFGQGSPSFLTQDAPWEDDGNGFDIGQVGGARIAEGDLDADADDGSRSKRQQGWYTQYGKRSGETTTAASSGRTDLPEDPTRSGGSSSEFRRQITERMSSILKDIFILADEVQRGGDTVSRAGDAGDADEQPAADAAAPSLDKRQQGWYIQYGKRSNPGYASL